MEWHLAQQHRVFIVSGSLAPIVRAVVERISVCSEIKICATELESVAGKWTGHTAGAAICGPEKARAVARIAAEQQIELSASSAYGNSSADRWILAAVENPFAVNPDRGLAHLAVVYGWPILNWKFEDAESRLCQSSAARHPIIGELKGRKLPWA